MSKFSKELRRLRKRIRLPGIGALVAKLGAIAAVVSAHPHLVQSVAGKSSVGILLGASIVSAITKPVLRDTDGDGVPDAPTTP